MVLPKKCFRTMRGYQVIAIMVCGFYDDTYSNLKALMSTGFLLKLGGFGVGRNAPRVHGANGKQLLSNAYICSYTLIGVNFGPS